ncbi:glycosyltransferase [Escherichia albertii]|uniref:glycosyltransferase n=1 Tax=Escherichia albertii TaxID=208962 RepID=UPI0030C8E89B
MMIKKKICFFAIDLYERGGLQRVTIDIANQLSKYCEVHILTFQKENTYDFAYRLDEKVRVAYLEKCKRTNFFKRKVQAIVQIRNIKKYLYLHDFDALISVGMASVIWTIVPQLIFRCQFVCWDHTSYLRKERWAVRGRRLSKLFADNIVVLTSKDASLWGTSKVRVIYNPSPFDQVKADNEILEYKKKNQIISLGRFVTVKGFDRLLDIWKIVNSKCPTPYSLKLVGEGPLKEHLIERIIDEKISNVSVEPFSEDVKVVYCESKVQLLTSTFEGLSMVLIEGMTYCLPAISFDIPSGPAEIIDDGVTGYLIEDNDIEAFAEKIIFLISNDSLLVKMANNCKKKRATFDSRVIINDWLDLLKI